MTEQIPAFSSVNTQLLLPIRMHDYATNRDGSNNISEIANSGLQSIAKLPPIIGDVAKYVSAALSVNTRIAYQSDLADFIAWGGEIPCSPDTLAAYIADRAQTHSPFTIARRIVGISRAHTCQSLTDPAKTDLVRTVLRGVRRTHGTSQRQATPLLKADLIAILPLMEGSKGLRDRALILLGFACALRRSELVALDLDDIRSVREGLVVQIKRSKTDQDGIGRKIAVPNGRTVACPVKAVENWITHTAMTSGPLFRQVAKNGAVSTERLSSQSVSLLLKHYSARIGLDSNHISGHSLRAGLVTSAAIAGVPIWKIKAQSGHKSDAMVSRYIRDANLFEGNASGAIL